MWVVAIDSVPLPPVAARLATGADAALRLSVPLPPVAARSMDETAPAAALTGTTRCETLLVPACVHVIVVLPLPALRLLPLVAEPLDYSITPQTAR